MTRTIQSQENILRDKSRLQCGFKWKLQNACPGTLWKQYHIEVGKCDFRAAWTWTYQLKADVQNENPDEAGGTKKMISCTRCTS
jgi:hypothetical protein